MDRPATRPPFARWAWRGAGAAAAVAGLLLATVPPSRTVAFPTGEAYPDEAIEVPCVSPLLDVLGKGSETAWFAYAPNSGVSFSPKRISCGPGAWWRVGGGAALAMVGAAFVTWPAGRGRLRRQMLCGDGDQIIDGR